MLNCITVSGGGFEGGGVNKKRDLLSFLTFFFKVKERSHAYM